MSYTPAQQIQQVQSTITKDNWMFDAFGKNRVSNPETIFDSKLIHDNGPLYWDDQQISGTAGSTYNTNQSSVTLDVSATTAGNRTRQTFMTFNYQPGNSLLALITGIVGTPKTGNNVEAGLVDDKNGFFFYRDGTNNGVCIRSYISGSAVDTKVPQSSWSHDTMDGNGPSGITVDWTKTQIMAIDIEWLGVGSVRFWMIINGVPYLVHEQHHTNTITTVYMTSPNLPLRWKITNDGSGAVDSCTAICAAVISEGGNQPTGAIRYKSTEGTHMTTVTENIVYALMGIRLKSTNLDGTVELIGQSIDMQSATDAIEWMLAWNPTVAGTFTYNAITNSNVEIAIGDATNTVTLSGSAHYIIGGFQRSGSNNSGLGANSEGLKNAIRLGRSIANTPDEIVLCARPIDGSTAVSLESSFTWRDLN